MFFFFFQAEDGIRDGTVTGVQTCALPIFGIFLLRQAFKTVPRELDEAARVEGAGVLQVLLRVYVPLAKPIYLAYALVSRSEEHTSELQSQFHLVCRLLLEKKKHPPPL